MTMQNTYAGVTGLLATAAFAVSVPITSLAAVDIALTVDPGATPAQLSVLGQAEAFWESTLLGYQNGVVIDASSGAPQGPGVTMTGVAFDVTLPTSALPAGVGTAAGQPTSVIVDQLGFIMTSTGLVELDSSTPLELGDAIRAFGAALGFGTLWTQNGLYLPGSGEYTGAEALAVFQTEFDPSASFIPVELDGPASIVNQYWNDGVDLPTNEDVVGPDAQPGDSGSPLVVIDVSSADFGSPIAADFLSGLYDNTSPFLSATSAEAFEDLGYVVPEPVSVVALAVLPLLGLRRRR